MLRTLTLPGLSTPFPTLVAFAAAAMLGAGAAGAAPLALPFQSPAPAAQARRPGPAELGPEITAALHHAREALDSGDLAGAIAALEAQRENASAPPALLGTLGALYLRAERPGDALELLEPLAQSEGANAAVLYNAGRAALGAGRLADGERYLERSVALEANTPAARELGMLLGNRGDVHGAYALLRPWASTHPRDEEARTAAALLAVRLKRVPEARQLLEGLPSEGEEGAKIELLRGRLLVLEGDPHGAVGHLEPLLESAPPEMGLDVRRTLAEAYTAIGEAGKAVELLEGDVYGQPNVALELARAQYQSGDLESGLATLRPFATPLQGEHREALVQAQPDLVGEVALTYGWLLLASAAREEAVPYLELATELLPDNKQGWQSLGQALAALGRREEAQAALARFQEILQSEIPASEREQQFRQDLSDPVGKQIRLAAEQIDSGHPDEALAILRGELQISPGDLRLHLLEAKTLLLLGRNDEALAVAQRILEMAPDQPDAYYQLGAVHMARHEAAAAESDFRNALAMAPDHVAALSDLGVLLTTQGRTAEARPLLERVVELRPGDETAAAHLAALDGP